MILLLTEHQRDISKQTNKKKKSHQGFAKSFRGFFLKEVSHDGNPTAQE